VGVVDGRDAVLGRERPGPAGVAGRHGRGHRPVDLPGRADERRRSDTRRTEDADPQVSHADTVPVRRPTGRRGFVGCLALYLGAHYIVPVSMTEPTFFVLTALVGEPRHGYGIVGEVDALSGGRVQLKIGSL